MFDHRIYHAVRAIEERRLAMRSADARVRAVHLELAAKYAASAESCVMGSSSR